MTNTATRIRERLAELDEDALNAIIHTDHETRFALAKELDTSPARITRVAQLLLNYPA